VKEDPYVVAARGFIRGALPLSPGDRWLVPGDKLWAFSRLKNQQMYIPHSPATLL